MSATDVNIGIDETTRKEIADGLSRLLADSYVLYIKTHNYHWNVTGPMFNSLHAMFEEQYTDLAVAVDDIAERIRALGFFAPGSYKAFRELATIEEEDGVPLAESMIKNLVAAHEQVAATGRKVFKPAETGDDQPTIDLVTARLQFHEKTAWMLRSLLVK